MTKSTAPQDLRIVALSERWVFIGNYHAATDTEPAYLTETSCIRVWGTVAGLGEIALRGPTPKTVLDACGTLVISSVPLFMLKCIKK